MSDLVLGREEGMEWDYDAALSAFPGQTMVLGDSQVTVWLVTGQPDWLYVGNWGTRDQERHKGSGRAVMDALVALADEDGVTLVTHTDEPWMTSWAEQTYGFRQVSGWLPWHGRPFLLREPRGGE